MRPILAACLATTFAAACAATPHGHHDAAPVPDAREPVAFPEPLRSHTLANMRDHLLALQEVQQALADGQVARELVLQAHQLEESEV